MSIAPPLRRAHFSRLGLSRLGLLVLTLGLLLTSVSDADASIDPSVPWNATMECPDVLFVGVRGSGEVGPVTEGGSVGEKLGMGSPVHALYDEVSSRLAAKGLSVAPVPLEYPATSIDWDVLTAYHSSRTQGTDRLTDLLVGSSSLGVDCPNSRVILAGYSQGADVIHETLETTAAPNVRAVALIADPGFNPDSGDTANLGTYEGTAWGFFGPKPVASWAAGMTVSLCKQDDAFCQAWERVPGDLTDHYNWDAWSWLALPPFALPNEHGIAVHQSYSVADVEPVADLIAALAVGPLGSVSGRVVDGETGLPLLHVRVAVRNSSAVVVGQAFTDSSGAYRVDGVPIGRVSVRFESIGSHVSEWWHARSDIASADLVTVGASMDTSGIDAALRRTVGVQGSISGKVVAEATGVPLKGITVWVYRFDGKWTFYQGVSTNLTGGYSIAVPPGVYKVEFYPNPSLFLLKELWHDQPYLDSGDIVVVPSGTAISGIDAALGARGSISVSVTDADTGRPLGGVWIWLFRFDGSDYNVLFPWQSRGTWGTNADGTVFIELAPGRYKVVFSTGNWDDPPDEATGNVVVVVGGTDNERIDAVVSRQAPDTVAPVVTPPADVTVEATGPSGAVVEFGSGSASDAVGVVAGPTCSRASQSVFPIGTIVVTCFAIDAAGNVGSATFRITVRDTAGPAVSDADDVTVEAAGSAGSYVYFPTPSASDAVGVTSGPSCVPASLSLFPIAATTVTCTASDAAGNEGAASFLVTVEDTTPPVVDVPSDITRVATGAPGAAVWFGAPTASDAVGVALGPTCSATSGSVFVIGVTTVTCTASDAAGNVGSASFSVTVTPPLCDGLPATIVGTSAANVLTGSSERDVIVGLGGKDTINGLGGDDLICGGDGADLIYGGDGKDRILGQNGADTIYGDVQSDRLYGGDGNDTIWGGAGTSDRLFGGNGIDLLNGGSGKDDRCTLGETYALCEVLIL